MSTVHQPAYDMGRLAATAMLQLLAGTAPTGATLAHPHRTHDTPAAPTPHRRQSNVVRRRPDGDRTLR